VTEDAGSMVVQSELRARGDEGRRRGDIEYTEGVAPLTCLRLN
jgi:hypothetical protein